MYARTGLFPQAADVTSPPVSSRRTELRARVKRLDRLLARSNGCLHIHLAAFIVTASLARARRPLLALFRSGSIALAPLSLTAPFYLAPDLVQRVSDTALVV